MSDMEESGPRTLKTVETTCDVLNTLKILGSARLTELAVHLDMSKGGVYNHLATLRRENLVVKNGDRYSLSARFANFGEAVKHDDPLFVVGKPEVVKLADETNESTHLMVEQFGKGFYYHNSRARSSVSREYHRELREKSDYLHWSSTGKAILAEYSEERVNEIVDRHGLPAPHENTIDNKQELFEELETIRDRGYALNDEEEIRGVRAVGTAVKGPDSNVLGAISLSGPTTRIVDEKFHETYPELVLQTANVIEVNLETKEGFQQPSETAVE